MQAQTESIQSPKEMAKILYNDSFSVLSIENVDKNFIGLIAKKTAIDKVNAILSFSKYFEDQNAVPYFKKVLISIDEL